MLIGEENIKKLMNANVLIYGVGGVGGNLVEALARAGVGNITIVDFDTVDVSNLNRQVIALRSTIGKYKVDVMKDRVLDINPEINIKSIKDKISGDNINLIDYDKYDYIVDAIDDVKAKIMIISRAKGCNIPIISSMGTGNKMDPSKLEIISITKTKMCPLAKVLRKELRKIKINNVTVVYSPEEPKKLEYIKGEKNPPASISFVPASAGLLIAGKVVRDLITIS